MANLGEGSVIGLNELLVAQSQTYTTTLTCLSSEGEMYKIQKDVFLQKIDSSTWFKKRLL